MRTQLHPRVIHRIPGRLRLRIPLLKTVPDEWANVAEILERALAAPRGIAGVESDRRTGSLVIRYDPDRLAEEDVRAYLRSLLELLRRHAGRLAGMSNGQAVRAAQRFETWIIQHTRRRPAIDPEATIPDEIWT
jgi:hypothetical protein